MNHDEKNFSENEKPEMHAWIEPELEARIVAWVAGEASAFEIAELERLMAEKPELAIFKRRIEAVHGLIGEAAGQDKIPLQLEPERRAKLLATLRGKAEPVPLQERIATLPRIPSRWSWRAPRIYFTLSGVAAACLALFVTVQMNQKPKYAATATLQFQKPDNVVQARGVVDVSVQSEYDVNTYMQILNSAKMKQRVEESLRRDAKEAKGRIAAAEASGAPISAKDEALMRLVGPSGQNEPSYTVSLPMMSAPPATPVTASAPPVAEPKPELAATVGSTLNFAAASPGLPTVTPDNREVFASSVGGRLAGTARATGSAFAGADTASLALKDTNKLVLGGAGGTAQGGFFHDTSIASGTGAVKINESGTANLTTANGAPGGEKQAALDGSRRIAGTVTFGATANTGSIVLGQAAQANAAPMLGKGDTSTVLNAPAPQSPAPVAETVVLSPFTVSADRDVGYLAAATTSGTRDATHASTATAVNGPEVVRLDAFEVASPKTAARRAANSPKAPAPPLPVARARTAPKQQVASAKQPAASTPAPAPAVAAAPAAPAEGFSIAGQPAAATTVLGAASVPALEPRKDVADDELRRANLEAAKKQLEDAEKEKAEKTQADAPLARPAPTPPPPTEETSAAKEPTSTFSLHVSDVSFRLASAALARGELPDAARIRPEEFYNAFDYGDPAPTPAEKVSCRIEQSAHPFLQQRNLVRIAMKVGATGRGAGTPLRLTVLLDTSGSMERADRRATVQRAMAVLVSLLGPADRITLVGFARTPRLLAEAVAGNQAGWLVDLLAHTPPDGGTNLEEALKLAGELARRHRDPAAQNRIVMLTDGAANLGNAEPASLATAIAALRAQGIAFDACGVGLDGLDDEILESLTRSGDGRYYALNSPADADAGFAQKLAGAFRPAAENVKLQVRFNPARVGAWRLIGFEQHRLRAEDFRNDKVDAAELAAEEAAVALYQIEALPSGEGDLGEVFVRFRDPATGNMVERSWPMSYDARAAAFDRASPTLQLAGTAALLAEKIRGGAPAAQIRLADLAPVVNALGTRYAGVPRVQELAAMFAQLRRVTRE